MPILDLQRKSALPEIGRIRKGAPKSEQGYVGQSLDYFRFTPQEDNDVELIQRFEEVFGTQPKSISGYLAYASVDNTFVAWNEIYTNGGLQRQCDTKSITLLRQPDGNLANYTELPTSQRPMCAQAQNMQCECRPSGRLFLTIPQLKRWGAVCLVTSSKNDIVHIYQVLHHLKETIQNLNVELNQIPVRISRFNKDVTVNKGGQPQKYNVALIRVEPHPEWVGQLYDLLEKPQILSNTSTPPLQSTEPSPMIEQSVDVQNGREFYDEDLGMTYDPNEANKPPSDPPVPNRHHPSNTPPAPQQAPPAQPNRQALTDSLKMLFQNMNFYDQEQTYVKVIQMSTKTNHQSLDLCSDQELERINNISNFLFANFQNAESRLKSIRRCYGGLTGKTIDHDTFDFYTELSKDADIHVDDDADLPF